MTKPNAIAEHILQIIRQHSADHVAILNHNHQVFQNLAISLEQNITTVLARQLPPPNELHVKIQQLETEKVKLFSTIARFQSENNRLNETCRGLHRARDRDRLALSDVALHLAQASKFRPGNEDEIRDQLKKKGLEDDTIEMVMQSTGFMEELGQYIGPRRSSRTSSKA